MQLEYVHRSWTLTIGDCLFCRAIDAWLIIKTAFAIVLIIRARAIRASCSSASECGNRLVVGAVGGDLAGTNQVVNPPRSVLRASHPRRHYYARFALHYPSYYPSYYQH
jgi:hypothetical protein